MKILFLQVKNHFLQMKKYFLQVEKHFLQMENLLLQVENLFLQMKKYFLQMKKHFLQVKKYFLQREKTMLQIVLAMLLIAAYNTNIFFYRENDMGSKFTLSEQISSARLMADGLKKRADAVSRVGINEEKMKELEAQTAALAALDSAQEELKSALKIKTAELEEARKKLTETMSTMRKLVKIAVDQNDWLTFGIADKR